MFQWSLSITGYEVYFRLYPSYQKKQYYTLLDNTKQLYSFYEFLYKEPSIPLKILSEFGPKISFEDFENRFKATKNWK